MAIAINNHFKPSAADCADLLERAVTVGWRYDGRNATLGDVYSACADATMLAREGVRRGSMTNADRQAVDGIALDILEGARPSAKDVWSQLAGEDADDCPGCGCLIPAGAESCGGCVEVEVHTYTSVCGAPITVARDHYDDGERCECIECADEDDLLDAMRRGYAEGDHAAAHAAAEELGRREDARLALCGWSPVPTR